MIARDFLPALLGFVAITVALAGWFWAGLLGPAFVLGLAVAGVAAFSGPVLLAGLLLAWRNGGPGWIAQPRRFAGNVALAALACISAYVILFFTPVEPALGDGTYFFALALMTGATLVGWAERAATVRPRLAEVLLGGGAAYASWGALVAEAEGGSTGLWLAVSLIGLLALQGLPVTWPTRVVLLAATAPPLLLLDRFIAHTWLLRGLELLAFAVLVVAVWLVRDRLPGPQSMAATKKPG